MISKGLYDTEEWSNDAEKYIKNRFYQKDLKHANNAASKL